MVVTGAAAVSGVVAIERTESVRCGQERTESVRCGFVTGGDEGDGPGDCGL